MGDCKGLIRGGKGITQEKNAIPLGQHLVKYILRIGFILCGEYSDMFLSFSGILHVPENFFEIQFFSIDSLT